MIKAVAYIDGFNLYHAVHSLGEPRLKWNNPKALVESCQSRNTCLRTVKFYTARPKHLDENIRRRYTIYIKALKAVGVSVVEGAFKFKARPISKLRRPKTREIVKLPRRLVFDSYEEKETDVNIAIDVIDDLHKGEYDRMVLVSGDSDFIPVVKRVLETGKQIQVLSPPNAKIRSYKKLTDEFPQGKLAVRRIKADEIRNNLLPETVEAQGGEMISMPPEYSE